ncbi:MAG: IS200/IS605 family accessory protein TnpB-related protein [Bacillota bacterium]|nr:IS200/IS605 family accessory protein TnpB-related protein [Bacillota bacterium]
MAETYNCAVAIEDLKFKDDKDVSRKFARIKHQFIYSKLLTMLETACYREGIQLIKVKPQYTSIIGLYKYSHQYKMNIHNSAAMVIGRRSYGFKEKIPKPIKDKLTEDKIKFDKKTEWGRWSEINKVINKILEGKEREKPGLWSEDRKQILGLVN